jgi:sugar phosphate isomerase/epimerase
MNPIGSKIDETRIDGDLEGLQGDLTYFHTLGLEAVELPVHGLDAIKNGQLDVQRVRKVRKILRHFTFCYSVHSPNPLNLMDERDFDMHLQVFRASLDFSLEIGAQILVYHAGRFIPEETFPVNGTQKLPPDQEQRLLEQERAALLMLAKEYPEITICIENARPYLVHSPYCYGERLDALKTQVLAINRRNVRVNLDLGHLHMASRFYQFDPVGAVAEIGDLVAHTHVHDNFGGAVHYHEKQQTHQLPFGRGDSHMPIGWGTIPFTKLLSSILPGYRGMLMMELRSRYFANVEESKFNLQRLIASLEFAEALSA